MAESNRVLRPLAAVSSVQSARDGCIGMMMMRRRRTTTTMTTTSKMTMTMTDDVQDCTHIDKDIEVRMSN